MKKNQGKKNSPHPKAAAPVTKTAAAKSERSFSISRYRGYFEFLIILILSFITYGNSIRNSYNIDDAYVVSLDDENTQTANGISGIPEILSTKYSQGPGVTYGYRPLGKITMAIEFSLWGNNPHYSHFINVLLFALNCFLLLLFIRKVAGLLQYKNEAVAYLAILLFIIHPIHTEVVDSIKNREEILCFIFMLAALLSYFRFRETENKIHMLAWAVFIVLSLLSKQTGFNVLTVIIVIAVYTALATPAETRDTYVKWIIPLTACVIAFICCYYILKKIPEALPADDTGLKFETNPYSFAPGSHTFPNGVQTLLFYFKKFLIPFPLLFFYGYDMLPDAGWNSVYPYIGILLFAAIIAFLVYSIRKKKALFLSFWLLFLGLTIVPFANIGIFANVTGIVGERLVYQASAAFCLLLAMGIYQLAVFLKSKSIAAKNWSAERTMYTLAAIIVLPFLIITITRNKQWIDKINLYRHDMQYLSNSARANYMMAGTLMKEYGRSQEKSLERVEGLDEAKMYFAKAVSIYPKFNDAWLGLGTVYNTYLEMPDSALACYSHVDTSARYTYVRAQEKMGDIYALRTDSARAISYYQKSLAVYDANLPVYQKAIDMLLMFKRYDEVLALSEKGIKNQWPEAYVNKGDALLNKKDTVQAVANYELALKNGLKSDVLLKNLETYYRMKGQLDKIRLLPR